MKAKVYIIYGSKIPIWYKVHKFLKSKAQIINGPKYALH